MREMKLYNGVSAGDWTEGFKFNLQKEKKS